ncbi:MAG: carbohydrate binding domain-containing protein [Armatimonadetes bacterium]|nr:carbohydrate binding domain-containing protein [Armatimonadota bacterium]MDW8122520.1 carbohydrate binding domain-containing protein [Armatimonadota bacterium]
MRKWLIGLGLMVSLTVLVGGVMMKRANSFSRSSTLFPFVLPWDDDSPGITNISHWSPKPAGMSGFIRVGKDGHFYEGKNRIRFFGVNLCFGACFPRKEDSEKIAARMAKFGINVVRFHHLDMFSYPDGIRDPQYPDTRHLHKEALDRLDYLIYQLKKNGIYTNLNLLVSRPFNAADGLPREIEELDWKERHIVGFFYQPMIELQKEYAKNLLTHYNPYTRTTYSEEPAIAFVEINNENGLIHSWLGYQVDRLPKVFLKDLQRQWNDWLRKKYRTTTALRKAWGVEEKPLGPEMLANRDFSKGLDGWVLEQHFGAQGVAMTEPVSVGDRGPKSPWSLKITVIKRGQEDWHVQLNQPGLRVEKGIPYTLSFWARSDRPTSVSIGIKQAHEPWQDLGFRTSVKVTEEWQQFSYTFIVSESDTNARLDISGLSQREGSYWFADFSLRTGGIVGLSPEEKLEKGSIEIVLRGQQGQKSLPAQRDWMSFLWEVEDRYWQTLYRYIKKELKARGLVIGTIVGCSSPNLMSRLDAVDTHAYWQHPIFPSRPWDAEDWIVPNRTMVQARGGTLPGIALRRVLGKPHCVTEYNHPAPNTYSSEAFLLLAAYGALQDWDAIYAFSYSHRRDQWDIGKIPNFFDIDQHPTKMVTLVPSAALFRRGDVKPAKNLVCVSLPIEKEKELLLTAYSWNLVHAGHLKVPSEAALVHRVAIATQGRVVPSGSLTPPLSVLKEKIVSDTGELVWDESEPARPVVLINAEKSKAVIGFGGGRTFELGWLTVDGLQSLQDGWVALTVTEMDGADRKPTSSPPIRRFLITATGYAENTNMVWKDPEKSSVGRQWGDPPSLVEGIAARLTFRLPASEATAWALDERGQRKKALPVRVQGQVVSLSIGPDARTLWYELEIR